MDTTSNIAYASLSYLLGRKTFTMKTIAAIFALSCLALCLVNSEKIERWGLTRGTILAEIPIVANRVQSQYQIRSFSFPEVSNLILENM